MGDLFPFPLRISRIVDATSATHRWHLMLSLYATLHITALQRLMSKTNKKSIRALSYTSQNTTASKLLMLIYLDVPMVLKIVQCIKKEGYHDVGECHGNQGGKRFPAGCLWAFGPHFELDLCWILLEVVTVHWKRSPPDWVATHQLDQESFTMFLAGGRVGGGQAILLVAAVEAAALNLEGWPFSAPTHIWVLGAQPLVDNAGGIESMIQFLCVKDSLQEAWTNQIPICFRLNNFRWLSDWHLRVVPAD